MTTDRQRRYQGQFTLENIFDAEHGLGAVYCIYTFAVLGQMQPVLSSPLLWSRAEHGLLSIVYHQTSFWNFKRPGSTGFIGIMVNASRTQLCSGVGLSTACIPLSIIRHHFGTSKSLEVQDLLVSRQTYDMFSSTVLITSGF